jgi:Fn3 domain-containing protein
LPSNSGKKRPFGEKGALEKGALKDYYSSLSAPGLTAWINLLKGEPTLILLDELPPYFENARSRPIGNSDLSRVTTTALSNLLVAVGRDELSNVCVVISDLKATYEGGSQQILLKLVPVYGDTIHYEVGANATTDSLKISDMKSFQTDVLTVPFLCVDSTREHETGNPVTWRNRITIKSRVYQDGENKMIELRAAPEAPIRYTTDGSDPKISGVPYDAPFVVPPGTLVVLAIAEKDRVVSELHRLEIDWKSKDGFKVDPGRAITWKREHMPQTTKESYEFLGRLKKYEAAVPGPRVSIVGQHWLELAFDDRLALNAEKLETAIDHLRSLLSEGQVAIDALALKFPTGQRLLDWVKEVKTEIKPQDVEQ